MSDDIKNTGSSSEPSDPLFDALKAGTDEQPKNQPVDSSPEKIDTPAPSVPTAPAQSTAGMSFSAKVKHFLSEKLTRKEYIIGSIVFVLLLGGGVAFGLTHWASAPTVHTAKKKQPVLIYSPLTGLPVTAAQAKRPVTGVMIENSDFARPQSGLKEAGVVFEAIAEAGITRFLALYQESAPANIGPIRSARPYYVQWALGFDAAYSHVGGSPEALQDITSWHVKDMNEFYYGGYYHRISSREAPHNMYTSMEKLNEIEKKNGWTTSHFTGFLRKKDAAVKTPTARNINFAISSSDFYVRYQYDPKHNAYLRWEGGAAHIDATTKHQLEPKVVIGLVMPYSLESDGYHSMYNTIGSGKAYVFQDGKVTIGVWKKTANSSQFSFTDAAGKPIKLNRGQTWITALASASEATYKP